MNNLFKSLRWFIAVIFYPEILQIERQNEISMDFVVKLSREWKEDVKAKERGINKLHKKIKYLNNQVSKLQKKNDNSF